MRLTQPDYIKLVKAAYNKKRANNELSPLLAQSTPANIRRECVHVYQERYDNRDEKTLRAFFGPAEHGRQFLQVIENFATDRFRPLDNYLKNETETTDDRNLELLAWLIDFRHRPFSFAMEVILNADELDIIGKPEIVPENIQIISSPEKDSSLEYEEQTVIEMKGALNKETKESATDEEREKLLLIKKRGYKSKTAIIFFLIIGASLLLTYAILQQQKNKQLSFRNANTGCMYWTGDHYDTMRCNEERKDRLKLPLDPERMKNFKKILLEDTITEKSIGKVYYIRIDNRVEYYTTSGNHPIYVTRPLKPLSPYMFEKHLLKQENTNKVP